MNQPDTFDAAADFFNSVIEQVIPAQWDAPTPCDEWNVRQLINHVVVEQLWVPPLLDGKTISDVGASLDGDQLGTDPKLAWVEAVTLSRAAFSQSAAMSGTVHLSYGDDSVANYCDQMTLDALVHGWDLAVAIDTDATLPPDLVAWAWELVAPNQELLTASGMFGTPLDVPNTADSQTRLLAVLGRAA